MTQIQFFPAAPFPAIALVLAEQDKPCADPATFLALAKEAGLPDDAEVAVSVPPAPVTGWPLSSCVAAEVPTVSATGSRKAEVQVTPETAVAPPCPMATGAILLPPHETAGLAEEVAVNHLPEAEASDPAAPVSVPAPAAPLVPLAAVLPVQAGTESTVATTPGRVERAGLVSLPDGLVAASGSSDRVAPRGPDQGPALPTAPATITGAEAIRTTPAPSTDAGTVEPQMQDIALIPAVFEPQDMVLSGQKVVSVMQAVPADLPALPEPVVAESGDSEVPAADRAARRGEENVVVADPPDIRMDRRSLPLAQPGMAREERLWRSLWPAAEARSVPTVVAAEAAAPAPAPDKGGALPAAPAMAEAEDQPADDPDAVSPLAKPEPKAPVADRADPAVAGPVNATPGPLLGIVPPIDDPVSHILHPARALPSRPMPAAPAPPVQVQIVQALSSGGAVTELRLAPGELGHVRIGMRHEGDRLVMTVLAERQDTLDLLRRHAGELATELRAAGHSGLDLSFGHWSGPGAGADSSPRGVPEAEVLWPDQPERPPDAGHAAFNTHPHQLAGELYLRI